MSVAAAGTALSAYLLGTMTNEAYVERNFRSIVDHRLARDRDLRGQRHCDLRRDGDALQDRQPHRRQQPAADVRQASAREIWASSPTGIRPNLSRGSPPAPTPLARSSISLSPPSAATSCRSSDLTIVMVTQDPVMSLVGFVVAPPAFLVLRKLVRRVRGIARTQFTGGTRIIETMQEALQGMRMVKAFSLEDEMRRRLAVSVEGVERDSNKMARVSARASPLMETLGGLAIALATIYGGYRMIETGATPGQFVAVPCGVPARLRTGQKTGAPQHRPQQQPRRRSRALRGDRQPAGRAGRLRPAAAET